MTHGWKDKNTVDTDMVIQMMDDRTKLDVAHTKAVVTTILAAIEHCVVNDKSLRLGKLGVIQAHKYVGTSQVVTKTPVNVSRINLLTRQDFLALAIGNDNMDVEGAMRLYQYIWSLFTDVIADLLKMGHSVAIGEIGSLSKDTEGNLIWKVSPLSIAVISLTALESASIK